MGLLFMAVERCNVAIGQMVIRTYVIFGRSTSEFHSAQPKKTQAHVFRKQESPAARMFFPCQRVPGSSCG